MMNRAISVPVVVPRSVSDRSVKPRETLLAPTPRAVPADAVCGVDSSAAYGVSTR